MNDPQERQTFPEAVRRSASDAFPAATLIGRKAPVCWDGAWLATEELYRFAVCEDTCPGPQEDHAIRLLVGRISTAVIGALEALERGHYDVALIVCRVLLEQHNLLALLLQDEGSLTIFKRSEPTELRKELSPSGVRQKLRALDLYDPIIDEVDKRFGGLSERAIHPALEQLAAAHMPGRVVVGPLWQPAGFYLGLNELAFAAIAIVRLLMISSSLDDATAERASTAINRVADGLGGMRIDHLPEDLRHNIPVHRWLDGVPSELDG